MHGFPEKSGDLSYSTELIFGFFRIEKHYALIAGEDSGCILARPYE